MPRTRHPRAGSMQFWPRVRSKYSYPRIRKWVTSKEINLLGFAGYKVGMTHLLINDNKQHSLTKGTEIFCPITVIECPPIKTASIKFYKNTKYGKKLVSELFAENIDKELENKLIKQKKKGKETSDYDFVRLQDRVLYGILDVIR
jgi:large subunit ribosomal protein L3